MIRRVNRSRSRQGAVLIAALVVVVVATTICTAAIAVSLRARQARKSERDLVQLDLLCDAGMRRARERLAADKEYQGESWLTIDSPYGDGKMIVEIKVSADKTPSDSSKGTDESAKMNAQELVQIEVKAVIEGRAYQPPRMQRTRNISEVLSKL